MGTIPHSIDKKCRRTEKQNFSTVCPKKLTVPECDIVAKEVASSCFKTESYEQEYDCFGTETTMECDAHMDVVESSCERLVQFPVELEKEELVHDRVCSTKLISKSGF